LKGVNRKSLPTNGINLNFSVLLNNGTSIVNK
jgi:hypothetical protein